MPHDDAWFDTVFKAHAGHVYRYFARRAPRDDVEDLTADVFATAWRRRRDVPEVALPWLYRTAALTLANYRRKMRALPLIGDSQEIDDADPEALVIADDEVREVLAALEPRDRRILLANAWEGMTGRELAEHLGISRGGADAALSRARARLREAWTRTLDPR